MSSKRAALSLAKGSSIPSTAFLQPSRMALICSWAPMASTPRAAFSRGKGMCAWAAWSHPWLAA